MSRIFDDIIQGLDQAVRIAEGKPDAGTYTIHVPDHVDVKAIRCRRRITQSQFAARYGFTAARIRDWEQGRSAIDRPSRIYLMVIDREPDAIDRALAGG